MPSTSTIDYDSSAAHFLATHRLASILVFVFVVGTFALVRWGYKSEPYARSNGVTRIPECLRNRCPMTLLSELEEGYHCPECRPKQETISEKQGFSFFSRFRRIFGGVSNPKKDPESPDDVKVRFLLLYEFR